MTIYLDKLKDQKWKSRRGEIIALDGGVCRHCTEPDPPFHVHHIYYSSGREPWDYPDEALITLCDWCHKIEHQNLEEIVSGVGLARANECRSHGLTSKDSLVFYITADGEPRIESLECAGERCLSEKQSTRKAISELMEAKIREKDSLEPEQYA